MLTRTSVGALRRSLVHRHTFAVGVSQHHVSLADMDVKDVTVRQVLQDSSSGDWRGTMSVHKDLSVFEATAKMVQHSIGSLAVLDDGGNVCGILTERDYLTKVLHQGRTSKDTLVHEIATMKPKLILASAEDTLQDCIDVMAAKDIRHLPVTDDSDEVLGMLSMKDIAQSLARERDSIQNNVRTLKQEATMPIHDG